MPMPKSTATALALLASLAACNTKSGNSTDALDKELVNGIGADVDPALTSALGNQIVVDPARTKGARPAAGQKSGGTNRSAALHQNGGCDFKSDLAWVGKLPAAVRVYPGAKVSEAAGSDQAGCRRRVVSFTAAVPPAKIIDYYRSRVTAAGYSVEQLSENGADVLGGTRGEAAYYLTVTPTPGGSAVDLIAN